MGTERLLRYVVVAIVSVASASVACVGDDPILVAGSNDGASADAAPTSADAASADAATDGSAAEDLLENGDFELGCAGWLGLGSAVTDDSVAHGGAKSCRVCSTVNDSFSLLAQSRSRATNAGERFLAGAWVRATDDKPSDAISIELLTVNSRAETLDYSQSTGVSITKTWQHVTGLLSVENDGATGFAIHIGSPFVQGAEICFLVDDATFVRTP